MKPVLRFEDNLGLFYIIPVDDECHIRFDLIISRGQRFLEDRLIKHSFDIKHFPNIISERRMKDLPSEKVREMVEIIKKRHESSM
jgi:hypothetical protein